MTGPSRHDRADRACADLIVDDETVVRNHLLRESVDYSSAITLCAREPTRRQRTQQTQQLDHLLGRITKKTRQDRPGELF
jgi:hypothetical protein